MSINGEMKMHYGTVHAIKTSYDGALNLKSFNKVAMLDLSLVKTCHELIVQALMKNTRV
jgi:hypothetical protein